MEDRIKFDCDLCGTKIKAQIEHIGKKGKCPKCKEPCIVPEEEIDILKDLADLEASWDTLRQGDGINED